MIYGIKDSRHVSMEGMDFNEDQGLNFCDGFLYGKL